MGTRCDSAFVKNPMWAFSSAWLNLVTATWRHLDGTLSYKYIDNFGVAIKRSTGL